MLDLTNTTSLSEFSRNTRAHIEWLKETGQPELLTVNGEAAVVVQSAAAYQELMRRAEYTETIAAIREGLAAHDRGQAVAMRKALEALANKNGFSLKD